MRMDSKAKQIGQNNLRYWIPAHTGRTEGYSTVTIADVLVTSHLQKTLDQHIPHPAPTHGGIHLKQIFYQLPALNINASGVA